MTNVVGILIIVLIVTQLSISQATKRIRGNLPDVSETQLAQKKEELNKIEDQLKTLTENTEIVTPPTTSRNSNSNSPRSKRN